MKLLRVIFKLSAFLLLAISYILTTSLIILVLKDKKSKLYLTRTISLYSSICLFVFNVKVTSDLNKNNISNFLIVSNHLSYLDILVIASKIPTLFITSTEMKNTFFLGHLCRLGGCIFVNRRNKKNIQNEIREMTTSLDEGLNVLFFPEATSTNGDEVLKFKRPLFNASILTKKNILPLCLNYKSLDDTSLKLNNRDKIFWYGDMEFFSHFCKFLSLKQVEVELKSLTQISPAEKDINTISEIAHSYISFYFLPVRA